MISESCSRADSSSEPKARCSLLANLSIRARLSQSRRDRSAIKSAGAKSCLKEVCLVGGWLGWFGWLVGLVGLVG